MSPKARRSWWWWTRSVSDEAAEAEGSPAARTEPPEEPESHLPGGDTTDRALLDELNAADYDHVIVLSYTGLDIQAADAKTLITLLHLRDIAEKDETPFSIVSEMLDLRNRELAEVAQVDDFIVSDHLISLMMTQLSENGRSVRGLHRHVRPGRLGDLSQAGRRLCGNGQAGQLLHGDRSRPPPWRGGHRLPAGAAKSGDAAKSYGVHTNPKKSEQVTFAPEDKVIVLAEE